MYLEREKKVSKSGKEYYVYFVNGTVRGRNVKIDFKPKTRNDNDYGVYEILDIVYNGESKVELNVTSEIVKNEETGKEYTLQICTASSIDEDGIIYECQVTPLMLSDKQLLNMLLQRN